jgi:hypothetical protein
MANLRERLTNDLQLSADQQTRLDAVLAEMRPRFMGLRDLPEDQRMAAREQLTADMRRRIAALLTTSQQERYAALQAQADAARQGGPAAGAAAPAPSSAPPAPTAAPAKGGVLASPSAAAGRPSVPAQAAVSLGGTAAASAMAAPAAAPSAPASPGSPEIAVPSGGVAPPLPPGGPMVETRNRLVAELKMDAAQAAKLDAIYESARPRFMALRDLPAEERPKARERISADIRARIGEILAPPQKARYAAMSAEAASRPVSRGRIHLLNEEGQPQAYNVRLGITDGTMTELIVPPNSPLAAVIKEGATVITAVVGGAASGGARAPSGPRLPF